MGRRIIDLGSSEFAALFTGFGHTAYRLERLPWYGVGYEDRSFAEWRTSRPVQRDPERDAWTSMVRAATDAGKVFQRVHLVAALTEYLRYEFEHWYPANIAAGDDVRIWPEPPGGWPPGLPRYDYWLFDSHDLWVMNYTGDGAFEYAELVDDVDGGWTVVDASYWRDAALHSAIPFAEFIRQGGLPAAPAMELSSSCSHGTRQAGTATALTSGCIRAEGAQKGAHNPVAAVTKRLR